MKSLIVKDLAVASDLNAEDMAAVRGGCYKGPTSPCKWEPSYCPPSHGAPSYGDFKFDATQNLNQDQCTVVNNGNNVAYADNITATVTPHQTGTNNISYSK